MLNRLRPQVAWLTGALLLGLLLTACGGASQSTPPEESAAPAQTEEAVATSANDQEVEKTQEAAATTETATEEATAEVVATNEAEATPSENPAASTSQQAICHPADPNNDQLAGMIQTVVEAPENKLIAAVSGNDWSKGPANAPVTLIEYGDFQ